ncbi:hypothetical protein GCM10027195_38480 [Comamonas sediminis]
MGSSFEHVILDVTSIYGFDNTVYSAADGTIVGTIYICRIGWLSARAHTAEKRGREEGSLCMDDYLIDSRHDFSNSQ